MCIIDCFLSPASLVDLWPLEAPAPSCHSSRAPPSPDTQDETCQSERKAVSTPANQLPGMLISRSGGGFMLNTGHLILIRSWSVCIWGFMVTTGRSGGNVAACKDTRNVGMHNFFFMFCVHANFLTFFLHVWLKQPSSSSARGLLTCIQYVNTLKTIQLFHKNVRLWACDTSCKFWWSGPRSSSTPGKQTCAQREPIRVSLYWISRSESYVLVRP